MNQFDYMIIVFLIQHFATAFFLYKKMLKLVPRFNQINLMNEHAPKYQRH